MSATPDRAQVRRGRPSRGRAKLSRRRVLQSALELVDAEGLDAVSMRRLAQRLGVDPMSLYNHVDDKAAILDGIAELMLESVDVIDPGHDVRQGLETVARNFRAAMLAHPRAAPVVLERRTPSPVALAPMQVVLASMLASGIEAERAVSAFRAMLAFLVGALMREVRDAPGSCATDPVEAHGRRRELEATGLPAIVATAPYISTIDHQKEFEFGLAMLLGSLCQPDSGPL